MYFWKPFGNKWKMEAYYNGLWKEFTCKKLDTVLFLTCDFSQKVDFHIAKYCAPFFVTLHTVYVFAKSNMSVLHIDEWSKWLPILEFCMHTFYISPCHNNFCKKLRWWNLRVLKYFFKRRGRKFCWLNGNCRVI